MKKLLETFDLPESAYDDEDLEFPNEGNDEILSSSVAASAMSNRIDLGLGTVSNFDHHDREMDEIAKKALETFEDLKALGLQVSDAHAGKIFEVAMSALKTAMEANDSKSSRKLRQIDLMIKKQKLDQMKQQQNSSSGLSSAHAGVYDRNELLELLMKTPVTIESNVTDS